MEQLKTIMDTDIERKHKFKCIEEIFVFEKKYNVNLPTAYRQFLFEYGGGYIKDDYCYRALENSPLTPKDGYNSTDYFYGSDIADNMKIYIEELEQKLIPIADAGGGDFICIGVNGEYREKIYYWAHEKDGDLKERLYLIANTFEEFILSFEMHEQEISLDDIELFLDDDLLND